MSAGCTSVRSAFGVDLRGLAEFAKEPFVAVRSECAAHGCAGDVSNLTIMVCPAYPPASGGRRRAGFAHPLREVLAKSMTGVAARKD